MISIKFLTFSKIKPLIISFNFCIFVKRSDIIEKMEKITLEQKYKMMQT